MPAAVEPSALSGYDDRTWGNFDVVRLRRRPASARRIRRHGRRGSRCRLLFGAQRCSSLATAFGDRHFSGWRELDVAGYVVQGGLRCGYEGVTTAPNSALMLSPTESPINRNDPTGAASNGAPTTLVVSNHGAGISNVVLNDQPLTVTLPAVPLMVTDVAYPFQSPPRPSWLVTTEVSVPTAGYLA